VGRTLPSAEGEDYRDLCGDPSACPCCSTWQRPDETREQWLARLGAEYRADKHRRYDHPERRKTA
jgi:hypothetical protein